MPAERLQKIIAAAGIASRRKAEELITSGLVSVNGQIVTELGSKADPEHDHIKVNGKLLKGPERPVYLLLNKPKGYVTTVTDPEGRPTVLDLVRGVGARIYPVGRLDYLSEGLLLLTNDGELAQKLMHASSHVAKTYLVKIAARLPKNRLTSSAQVSCFRRNVNRSRRPRTLAESRLEAQVNGGEHRAGANQAGTRCRQSLVRGHAGGRTQPRRFAGCSNRSTITWKRSSECATGRWCWTSNLESFGI